MPSKSPLCISITMGTTHARVTSLSELDAPSLWAAVVGRAIYARVMSVTELDVTSL